MNTTLMSAQALEELRREVRTMRATHRLRLDVLQAQELDEDYSAFQTTADRLETEGAIDALQAVLDILDNYDVEVAQ
jgi:hypothetical protein